jgi:hypothetical protein
LVTLTLDTFREKLKGLPHDILNDFFLALPLVDVFLLQHVKHLLKSRVRHWCFWEGVLDEVSEFRLDELSSLAKQTQLTFFLDGSLLILTDIIRIEVGLLR